MQSDQLRLREQARLYQCLTGGRQRAGQRAVVGLDRVVQAAEFHIPSEGADVSSWQEVPGGTVSRKVAEENLSGPAPHREGEAVGERCIVMRYKTEAQTKGQVHDAAQRDLMRAVEPVRPEKVQGIAVINRVADEVLLFGNAPEARERVGNLQGVVDRAAHREQHLILAQARVLAGESRSQM